MATTASLTSTLTQFAGPPGLENAARQMSAGGEGSEAGERFAQVLSGVAEGTGREDALQRAGAAAAHDDKAAATVAPTKHAPLEVSSEAQAAPEKKDEAEGEDLAWQGQPAFDPLVPILKVTGTLPGFPTETPPPLAEAAGGEESFPTVSPAQTELPNAQNFGSTQGNSMGALTARLVAAENLAAQAVAAEDGALADSNGPGDEEPSTDATPAMEGSAAAPVAASASEATIALSGLDAAPSGAGPAGGAKTPMPGFRPEPGQDDFAGSMVEPPDRTRKVRAEATKTSAADTESSDDARPIPSAEDSAGAAALPSTANPVPPPAPAPLPVEYTPPPPLRASDSGNQRTRTASAPVPSSSRKGAGRVVAQVLALSGQLPRTVEAVAPVEVTGKGVASQGDPAAGTSQASTTSSAALPDGASQSALQNNDRALAGGPQVRVLDIGTRDRGDVAFGLRLQAGVAPERTPNAPTAAAAEPPRIAVPESLARIPETAAERRHSVVALAGETAASGGYADEAADSVPDTNADRAAEHEHKDRHAAAGSAEPGPSGPNLPEQAAAGGTPQADPKFHPHAIADIAPKAEAAPARPENDAPAVKPSELPEPTGTREPPKTGPVRDVKLEITGQDSRVEVRLSERAGELKLTVRTPDGPLAGTLRENLPALHARLAESGLKSETWQPAGSAGSEWRNHSEPSRANLSQDGDAPPHQQDRESQGGEPRRQRNTAEPIVPKEKGKDFAWLMSSLR